MKLLVLFLILMASLTIIPQAFAQEDEELDTPAIIPNPNQSNTPPIIMDESDANDVEEVEEYEN